MSIIDDPEHHASPITLYTTAQCPGCALTQKMLKKEGVDFEVVNLSKRPDLVERFRAEGLLSAPIIDYEGQKTSGFRPDRIKAIIAAATTTNPGTLTPSRGAHTPNEQAATPSHTSTPSDGVSVSHGVGL